MIRAVVLSFILCILTVRCQIKLSKQIIHNCPRECDCAEDVSNRMGSGILVNCTGRNLKRFPYPMPRTTTTLILDRNRISSISQADFKGIASLKILSMQRNRLTILNIQSIGYLPLLTTLDFRSNRITEMRFQFLRNTPNVKVLILANNKISKLSYGTFDVADKMEFLDLSVNNISVIEDGSFLGLKRLKTLFLNHNRISKVSSQLFPDVFSLKKLHLDRNQITWIQPEAFTRHRFLELLSLGDNLLSHITYSTLTGLKNLKELYLQRNVIRKIDPWSLAQLKNLETLYLYSNFLDAVTDNIFVGLGKLKFLHLGMNNIEYIANDAFVDLRILVSLSLDSNRINTLSPRTFSGLRQLTDLQLYFNNITFVAKNSFIELFRLKRLVWDVPAFFRSQRQYANVQGNNLHCDCNALWLQEWLKRNNKKASISCQSPPPLKGRSLLSVSHVDMKCGKISVKVSPKKIIAVLGNDAVFKCTVFPGATFTWTLNGSAVVLDNLHTVTPLGTLTIKAVSERDLGHYVCVAVNSAGIAADSAELTVGARPSFTVFPESIDVDDPLKPVIFKCGATGIPPPKITWFKDNLEIRAPAEETSQFHITTEGALVYLGKRHYVTREGSLIILNPRKEDEASYTCVAANGLGKESYSINLYVDLSSKCLYGCSTGGVCQPSLFECVCTEGFYKRGHHCIRDVVPTTSTPATGHGSGSESGSGTGSSTGSGTGSLGSGTTTITIGSGDASGSGVTPTKSKPTNTYTSGEGSGDEVTERTPIDQESGDDYTPRPTRSRIHSTRSRPTRPRVYGRTSTRPSPTRPRVYGYSTRPSFHHTSIVELGSGSGESPLDQESGDSEIIHHSRPSPTLPLPKPPQPTHPSTQALVRPGSVGGEGSGSGSPNDSDDSGSAPDSSGSGDDTRDRQRPIKGLLRTGKSKKAMYGSDYPRQRLYLI